MEKIETYRIYISALNEYLEMPRELAENLTNFINNYRKANEGKPFYLDVDKVWYEKLSFEQKTMIKKS